MAKRASRQAGLWDLEIEDVEFEQALEDWLADKGNRGASGEISKRRREGFEQHLSKLKPGQRVRVGGFCFQVSANERDEYTVAPSTRLGMRHVEIVLEA